jgi:hypothetical protein
VIEQPYVGPSGPYSATANEYWVQLPGGKTINAGFLADYYQRMPEGQFPGLAEQMIQVAIAQAG